MVSRTAMEMLEWITRLPCAWLCDQGDAEVEGTIGDLGRAPSSSSLVK